jgi:hypothetical protein
MATTEQIAALRLMIAEPDGTTFSDTVLGSMIDQAENNLDLAAAEIWQQKAASASVLVDVNESGSDRKMSQVYKNAVSQAKYYADKVREDNVVVETVGRTRITTAVRR